MNITVLAVVAGGVWVELGEPGCAVVVLVGGGLPITLDTEMHVVIC